MALEPVTSPLKIRWKKKQFTATNSAGELVFDGAADGTDPLLCSTAGGTWRIQQRQTDDNGKYNPVLDSGGRQVARLEQHVIRRTQIVLPNGESIPVTKGRLMFSHGSRIGDLGVARAPFLFPQRYVKMTLSDELLARPDRELLVVVSAYLAESIISTSIRTSVSSA
jgi:hypothetical protein